MQQMCWLLMGHRLERERLVSAILSLGADFAGVELSRGVSSRFARRRNLSKLGVSHYTNSKPCWVSATAKLLPLPLLLARRVRPAHAASLRSATMGPTEVSWNVVISASS